MSTRTADIEQLMQPASIGSIKCTIAEVTTAAAWLKIIAWANAFASALCFILAAIGAFSGLLVLNIINSTASMHYIYVPLEQP